MSQLCLDFLIDLIINFCEDEAALQGTSIYPMHKGRGGQDEPISHQGW